MTQIKKNNITFNIDEPISSGFWSSMEIGDWEPYTFKIIDKYVNKNSICIDLGAWIGPITLYTSKLCETIHSIEPDKIAFEQLVRHSKLNINNIHLYNHAIADYDGKLTLGCDVNLGSSTTRINQNNNLFEINCCTLSTFCINNNIDRVDFLKIDVEGCEEFILNDIYFFKKYKPIVYIQLHNFWFSDKSKAEKTIQSVAKLYKHIYTEDFIEVSYDNITGGSFIFTDV
jgi:FkbM family methyltransferase